MISNGTDRALIGPGPFVASRLASASVLSLEASSGRPAGAREVGELVGFCRSPGTAGGRWPGPRGTAQQPVTSRVSCSVCSRTTSFLSYRRCCPSSGRKTTRLAGRHVRWPDGDRPAILRGCSAGAQPLSRFLRSDGSNRATVAPTTHEEDTMIAPGTPGDWALATTMACPSPPPAWRSTEPFERSRRTLARRPPMTGLTCPGCVPRGVVGSMHDRAVMSLARNPPAAHRSCRENRSRGQNRGDPDVPFGTTRKQVPR